MVAEDFDIRTLRMRGDGVCKRWQNRLIELADLCIHFEVADFTRDQSHAFSVRDSSGRADFIIYLHPRTNAFDEYTFERAVVAELVHILHQRVSGSDTLAALEFMTQYTTDLLLEQSPRRHFRR
jgi:hypothetical protein